MAGLAKEELECGISDGAVKLIKRWDPEFLERNGAGKEFLKWAEYKKYSDEERFAAAISWARVALEEAIAHQDWWLFESLEYRKQLIEDFEEMLSGESNGIVKNDAGNRLSDYAEEEDWRPPFMPYHEGIYFEAEWAVMHVATLTPLPDWFCKKYPLPDADQFGERQKFVFELDEGILEAAW